MGGGGISVKDFLTANSPVFLCCLHLDYEIRESYPLGMQKVKCGLEGGKPQVLP